MKTRLEKLHRIHARICSKHLKNVLEYHSYFLKNKHRDSAIFLKVREELKQHYSEKMFKFLFGE